MRRLLPFGLLFIAGTAAAQTPAKLEWPRSFTGQPDFAFTRDEALVEARARAARSNDKAPQLPTLFTLATDDFVADPLRLRPTDSDNKPLIGAATGTLAGADAPTVSDVLLANAVGLPAYASPTQPDLTEFKATLGQIITNTVASWRPDPLRYDYGSIINTLVLQAIVTSPTRYAVINGTRYDEGQSFLMRVPLRVPDSMILAAIEQAMPQDGMLDEATATLYRSAAEEVLATYAKERSAKPALGEQPMNVPVRVTTIETRRVLLEVYGRTYTLGVRVQY